MKRDTYSQLVKGGPMSTQVSNPRNARSRKLACSEILLDSGRAELPGDADAIASGLKDFEDYGYEDWDDLA